MKRLNNLLDAIYDRVEEATEYRNNKEEQAQRRLNEVATQAKATHNQEEILSASLATQPKDAYLIPQSSRVAKCHPKAKTIHLREQMTQSRKVPQQSWNLQPGTIQRRTIAPIMMNSDDLPSANKNGNCSTERLP